MTDLGFQGSVLVYHPPLSGTSFIEHMHGMLATVFEEGLFSLFQPLKSILVILPLFTHKQLSCTQGPILLYVRLTSVKILV